jgi:hypothetical protein
MPSTLNDLTAANEAVFTMPRVRGGPRHYGFNNDLA